MKFKKFKFIRRKKQTTKDKEQTKSVNDESLQIPSDEDGKIVFQFKNNIPSWLLDELNKRFRSNKDRGSRSGILPA